MKGGLLFQKLLSYTRFYLLACTMYGDKKTKEQDARVHHGILYSVEARGYGQLFRVSFLLIPPFPPNAPSPEKQRSDLN